MDKSIIKGSIREIAIATAIAIISIITNSENFAVGGLLAYMLYGLVETVYTSVKIKTQYVIWRLVGSAYMMVWGIFCFSFSLLLILNNNVIHISHCG